MIHDTYLQYKQSIRNALYLSVILFSCPVLQPKEAPVKSLGGPKGGAAPSIKPTAPAKQNKPSIKMAVAVAWAGLVAMS